MTLTNNQAASYAIVKLSIKAKPLHSPPSDDDDEP